jgi:hypothetical protein
MQTGRVAALAAGILLLAACAGGSPTARRSPSPSPSATPTPLPACAPAQADTVAAGVTSGLPVLVLASGLDEPDDVLVANDQIYVGEYGSGRIADLQGLAGSASANPLPVTIPEVEGIALLNGTMYVSDQQQDDVVTVSGSTVTAIHQLQPVPGIEGVDSIFTDGSSLVVPDSPHGILLVLGPGGQVQRTIGGFVRPTGGWTLPGGQVLIPDENAGQVVELPPSLNGRTVLAGGLGEVDDVAADAQGRIYAISIDQGRLVTVAGGQAQNVATGLGQPQGLGVDGAGNPVVSEYTKGRVDVVVTSFKLLPPAAAPVQLAPRQPLCVQLARAPGFTGAVTIAPGTGYRVVQQPGPGTAGSVEPEGCSAGCRVEVHVTSGTSQDTVWLAYGRAP